MAKVPNTISDKKMRDLQRRAHATHRNLFTKQMVAARKASEKQRKNADKS